MQLSEDTGTATGRDEIDVELFKPSETWISQYKKQCTPRLISGLNQYARTRALAVAATGKKVDDYYARGLVLDALGDTWLGIVRWDPDKCSLAHHLIRTVEGRADKHRKHAEDFPHCSIGDNTEASYFAECDASELVDDHERPMKRVLASEVMTRIRALATRDKPLLRILDAYDAGCETKEHVLAHAKMRDATYHKAYVRLRRIVRHLTDNQLAMKKRA